MRKAIFFFWLPTLLISCDAKKETSGAKEKANDVVKSYYANGNLRAEIPTKAKKKHGKAVEYFESGSKYQEIDYKDGIKDGWARRYYENGKLAQETPYTNGRSNGIQKKYRDNGALSTEIAFVQDEPCVGLKEYLLDGTLKKKYPTINVQPIDEVATYARYTLRISLSEKAKEVEYFTGQLTDEKFIGMNASKIWNTDKEGVAEIVYPVPPGSFIMEKVNIIAKVKTPLGNYYITQKSYNVAAESRY